MKKKCLAVGIILLFVGVTIAPTIAQNTEKSQSISRGNWLYVGGSGPGNYTRIQDAINNSSDGDIVFVFNDSSPYHENLVIDKSISVVGEDCNSTVILGNSSTDIMNINRERVLLSGFTIEISDDYPTELSIDANHAQISNNILKNITISSGRQYKVFIVGNIFKMNCSIGNSIVFNYMNDSIIEGNIFYGNRSLAVELAGCKKCEIKSNTINSILGIWVVFNGYSNIIANNTINSSEFCISYCGINGRIENNTVSNAYEGITIGFAIFTRVSRNVVKNCEIGISDGFSLLSFISANDFENNTIDAMVVDSLLSKWKGNYWGRPRILPKYILTIFGLPGDPDHGPGLIIPWFKFDFRPALKPNHSSS